MKTTEQVVWIGDANCDICEQAHLTTLYDAKTSTGHWAAMCPRCWQKYRQSPQLGTGHGQRYALGPDGVLVKVEG